MLFIKCKSWLVGWLVVSLSSNVTRGTQMQKYANANLATRQEKNANYKIQKRGRKDSLEILVRNINQKETKLRKKKRY